MYFGNPNCEEENWRDAQRHVKDCCPLGSSNRCQWQKKKKKKKALGTMKITKISSELFSHFPNSLLIRIGWFLFVLIFSPPLILFWESINIFYMWCTMFSLNKQRTNFSITSYVQNTKLPGYQNIKLPKLLPFNNLVCLNWSLIKNSFCLRLQQKLDCYSFKTEI